MKEAANKTTRKEATMKKQETPPIGEKEILSHSNVPVYLAAQFIGWSTPTLYRALQEQRAPFGFGVQNQETGSWAYNISPGLLVKYKRGDLPTYKLREVEELAVDGIERIVNERLSGLQTILNVALSGLTK